MPGSPATVAGTLPTGADVPAAWVAMVDCVATAAWPARRLSSMSFVFGFALNTAPVSSRTDVTPSAPTRNRRRLLRARSDPVLARQPVIQRPMAPLRTGVSMRR